MDAPPALLARRYRVVGVLGDGGMGRVYEVEAGGSRYAAKVLKPAFRHDEELVRRMFREAQAAAAIRHPGIVGIHAVAHDDEHGPVLVMERLDGLPLGAFVERRPLDAVQARWLALKVLDALGAAHRHGVVHRDVKPGNVFVELAGEAAAGVRLLDFGVAGLVERPGLTFPGQVMGTEGFASPEQLLERSYDRRSDIYGLGATLLYALTGRHLATRDVLAR